jgi:hypothetical protein
LIESILLGIPIPQIFVAQRPDGVWDVVDGLQRLSTIYQFVGILRDEDGRTTPPLTLESTKYLPSLEGRRWEDDVHPDQSLTPAQRLLIKRAKIDVSIILKESDEKSKYELFQRLNTGGSQLSDQEVRNSIVLMLNRDFFRWMRSLASDPAFQECVALSERAIEEQYDMELVLRFLVFRAMPANELVHLRDIGDFLTERAADLARDKSFDLQGEEEAFRATFSRLQASLASDSFRHYDEKRGKFVGGFSVSAFETIAIGLGYNWKASKLSAQRLADSVKSLWTNAEFRESSGSGAAASSRVPKVIPLGRKIFSA